MNGIEDRLREELKEFSLRAQPESLRPLRPPAPRRRTRTIRWLAPAAAATAVVAVVAGATLAGHTMAPQPASKGHAKVHNYPLIPAYPGMPAYYVALTQTTAAHGPSTTMTADVYDTRTGHRLGKVPVPEGGSISGNVWISGAASDREFVISGADSSLYLLRLAVDGRPEGLRRLPIEGARMLNTFPALSPDGSSIAYVARVCGNSCLYGVGVMPLGQPSAAKLWLWQGLAPSDLSWTADGKQVMFSLASGHLMAQDTQYRLMNITGPGGDLLTDSQPISHLPVAVRGQLAVLTPDGRGVIGSIVRADHGRSGVSGQVTGEFVEVSRDTGRQRLLYETKAPGKGFWQQTQVLSLASTGVQPLVVCNQGLGLIERGKFIPRPGLPVTRLTSGEAAAW